MTSLYYIPQGWNRVEDPVSAERKREGRRRNGQWLSNPPKLYWGKWVVLGDGNVLGAGRTREEAVRMFQASRKRPHSLLVAPVESNGAIFRVYEK